MAEQGEKQNRRSHFTLWLGIFAIILILTVIQIDWMKADIELGRKSREKVLKGNLQGIRNAIDQFKADTGVYPATLTDLTVKTGVQVKAKIKPGSYKGPYLPTANGIDDTGIPVNPLKYPSDPDYQNLTAHWRYDANTGKVYSNITTIGKDVTSTLEGTPYSEL
ncbi:MAG: hypothetical protein ACYC6A_14595 [Armatimonadota bacterium]